ncbi:MAG: SUMF1/EgtB/PvdO family nonheme iron enzyme, partial [Planctomycetota bacterium]
RGDGAAVEAVLRGHPETSDLVKRRLDALERAGFLAAPAPSASAAPERLGPYRLIRLLGGGGMGVVYLAEQESPRRRVALKIIRPEHAQLHPSRERFRREVEAIARLQHPGIVPVYSFGEQQGIPYFAMEWIDGASAAELLRGLGDRSPRDLDGLDLARLLARRDVGRDELAPLFRGSWVQTALRIGAQVADALAHAHQRQVLHRDVKPSNIMISLDGSVRLVDFGLATWQGVTRLTRTGTQLGSLAYMPPEQVRGELARMGAASDVYSLGVTLYELLTLRNPFLGETADITTTRILKGESEPLRKRNPAVSRDVETVCVTAMDPDPLRRYASAALLGRDIAGALEFRGVHGRRPGRALRARRWMRHHPARALVLSVASVLSLVGPPAYNVMQAQARTQVHAALAREQQAHAQLASANDQLGRALAEEQAQRSLAESALSRALQLADATRLLELEQRAAQLWPCREQRIDDMRRWLVDAESIAARLPVHQAALRSVRGGVFPFASGANTAQLVTTGDLEWWAEVLSSLVERLLAFTAADPAVGLIANVRQRIARAERIWQASVGDYESEWEATIAAIAASAAYGGLTIEPQIALAPLGPDPRSGLFEFWQVETGERPQRDPRTGELRLDAASGVVLVLLPGGRAWMGSQRNHPEDDHYCALAAEDETLCEVVLDPFFIAKYELTQAQWFRAMGTWPSRYGKGVLHLRGDHGLHPVEQVSWEECGQALGRSGLVLPTEAQWEYAARAGSTTPWWSGRDGPAVNGCANLLDQSIRGVFSTATTPEPWSDGHAYHAPVGSFRANAFGLHDVLGNVSEWCLDAYVNGAKLPAPLPRRDGDQLLVVPPSSSDKKVLRGGSFQEVAAFARSAVRFAQLPAYRGVPLGCRPARPLESR